MKRICVLLLPITILLAIFSCNKEGVGNRTTFNPLTPFTVTVLSRIPTTGVISWTASNNYYNGDTVKYNIYLNNILIKSNLIKTKDTLTGLSGDSIYYGRVFAYTNSGDTASAPFVLEKVQEFIAFNSQNNFEVYSLSSGVRLWSKPWFVYSYYDGSPTILGDTIFFSNNQLATSFDKLFASNLKTGQNVWSVNAALNAGTNPVLDNGNLYVSTFSGLRSINKNTGQLQWNYPSSQLLSTPVISNDKVFVYSISQHLLALNKNTGTLQWQFPVNQSDIRPLLIQNLVAFGTVTGTVYTLNQSNGSIAWQRNFPGNNSIEPLIALNNIIIAFVNQDGFYGLNPLTGAILWRVDVDWLSYPSITKGNGYIYYIDYRRDKIVALNPSNGNTIWEVNGGSSETDLIFAKNKLYSHNTGVVISRNYATGQTINAIPMLGLTHEMGEATIRINDSTYFSSGHGNFK